jgi:probable HAF family extracellular repeat protein
MKAKFLFLITLLPLFQFAQSVSDVGQEKRKTPLINDYKIEEFFSFDGISSTAMAINNFGTVIGLTSFQGFNSAIMVKNGVVTYLDPDEIGLGVWAINDNDKITGFSYLGNDYFHAFLWENGTITDLDQGVENYSWGYAINNSGIVVGHRGLGQSAEAVQWQNGTSMLLNPNPGSGNSSIALGINDQGQIVISENSTSTTTSYLWQNGGFTQLPGIDFGVSDINNIGQIAGGSRLTQGGQFQACVYFNGVITHLGTLGEESNAVAVNDNGVVVGNSYISGQARPFLWDSGVMIDLNDLLEPNSGWILNEVRGINNHGQIVGNGYFNGLPRGFILSPIRYPVLIVPGIAGTYAADVNNDLAWLVARGISPENIQVDPLANVYKDLITTLENVGYEKDKNLFVVNYDWRVMPSPIDNNFDGYISGITATSITDAEFKYGVDYLGWYIKKACDKWRTDYNEELEYIDIISHSTGGLVTRSYIQSSAYGGVYDAINNHKLAKIRNFIMIGVPNRGASKAWNPLHDNWIADNAYRFVLSKIINRAFQKLKKGYIITGPDYYITWGSILDSFGNPNKELFIKKYVPTISGLLATFDFIDFGNGLTNVNSNPLERNSLILDLNNGYDLYPNANPNGFLDSTSVKVLYGTAKGTLDYVVQRNDPEFNALQSFTDWTRSSTFGGTIWYKDLVSGDNNGDETVPTVSAVGQFLGDNRATKIAFSVSNHTGMVSTIEVQSNILNILNVPYSEGNIATGSSTNVSNVLNIISDPVELFIIDGNGRRLGYSNTTGALTEIPNSIWFGNTDGMGYIFDSVQEPITLQLTGLGENYYVMVSLEDSINYGGVVLDGYLGLGEVINYQITLNPLSVDQINSLIPEKFELAQNYPNPFNPTTKISWQSPVSSHQTLKIYDVLGNEVATLVDEYRAAGRYEVTFDASNLASGIYIYKLTAGSFTSSKKLVLIK